MNQGFFADPAHRTLGAVLDHQAQIRPDRRFVVSDDDSATYGELRSRARRWAAALAELGVGAGDTVSLLSGNRAELVPFVFGVNHLGALWVPINPDERGAWLARSLRSARAKVVVVEAEYADRLADVAGDVDLAHVVVLGGSAPRVGAAAQHDAADLLAGAGEAVPGAAVSYGDTAAVLWTSGTTGRPKGVMQPHNAWIRAALTGAASSRTGPDDVLYCCLPMCNSAAWVSGVFRALVAGAAVALDRSFTVSGFWGRTRHFGATQAFTLGAMHLFLWQADPRPDDASNPVRCLGAVPMPDAILEPFKARFGIDIIQQGYGQSEVMGLLSRVDGADVAWNPGSVGMALPGIEVNLLDDSGVPVDVGSVGEFCVRETEPHVLFNGYFDDPEATAAAHRGGWYHTGDLGTEDEDGQYHFVDRRRDLIRYKGRSVSSLAVEGALRAHPDVAQVAAFAVAVPDMPQEAEVMAAVVARAGAVIDASGLARFVNDHNPHYMVPRYIDVVDELPLTPTGKVQKYRLQQRGVTPSAWDRDASGFVLRR